MAPDIVNFLTLIKIDLFYVDQLTDMTMPRYSEGRSPKQITFVMIFHILGYESSTGLL